MGERVSIDSALQLHRKPTQVLQIKDTKPIKALQVLEGAIGNDPEKRRQWLQEARIAAILGSCPRSLNSFQSGGTLISIGVRSCAVCHCRPETLVEIH